MCSRDTGKGLRPIPDCHPHPAPNSHHHLPTTSEGLGQRRKDIRGQWGAGGDIWRDGGAGPRRDMRTGWEEPLFWQFGLPACCSMVERRQKSRGAEKRDSNIVLAQPGSLGRTEEICLDLEHKPHLESGNAPEGTSKNV